MSIMLYYTMYKIINLGHCTSKIIDMSVHNLLKECISILDETSKIKDAFLKEFPDV